jgi:hypothetical protein
MPYGRVVGGRPLQLNYLARLTNLSAKLSWETTVGMSKGKMLQGREKESRVSGKRS